MNTADLCSDGYPSTKRNMPRRPPAFAKLHGGPNSLQQEGTMVNKLLNTPCQLMAHARYGWIYADHMLLVLDCYMVGRTGSHGVCTTHSNACATRQAAGMYQTVMNCAHSHRSQCMCRGNNSINNSSSFPFPALLQILVMKTV